MSVLDLIGLQRIFHDGKEMFRRKNLNFIGGTVTDNPKTDSTDISIGEGGGGGGGAVSSVFGRTGAVVAVLGDYTSSLINNASVVTGATVTIALNSLNAAISSLNTALGGKVSGPANATDGAFALYSGTTGKVVKNSAFTVDGSGNLSVPALVDGRDIALDGAKLDGIPPGGGGGGGGAVSSVFTRVGAVVAQAGDYTSSLVSNVSGVAGATVSAALDALSAGLGALDAALDATDAAVAGKADLNFTVVNNAAASLTLTANHAGKIIVCTYNAAKPIVIIPRDSTLNLPLGFTCAVVFGVHNENWVDVQSEVASGNYGIPARHANNYTDASAPPYTTWGNPFEPVTLVKMAADSWIVTGHK